MKLHTARLLNSAFADLMESLRWEAAKEISVEYEIDVKAMAVITKAIEILEPIAPIPRRVPTHRIEDQQERESEAARDRVPLC